jgi:hypothetical protein
MSNRVCDDNDDEEEEDVRAKKDLIYIYIVISEVYFASPVVVTMWPYVYI